MATDSSHPNTSNSIVEANSSRPALTVTSDPEVFAEWRHDVANALTVIFLTCEHAQLLGTPMSSEAVARILHAAEEIQLLHTRLSHQVSGSEVEEL
jgi:hypothetical protein